MKRNHLFFAAAAAILAFAACEPEETVGVPDIQVTPSSVSFQNGASSQTVTLTASRDWTVSGAPDWLAFDPSSGKASSSSQTVTITAMANPGYNRSADVTFTIGLMKAYVHVDQAGDKGEYDSGDGSKERPYSPSAASNAVKDLTWTDNNTYETIGDVFVKGKISRIADAGTFGESGTYGNASFYISEDGTQNNEFYCYRILYLGNKKYKSGADIKVGDEVIVCGQLMNYRGNTPETVPGNAYLYSLNGQTSGGGGDDYENAPSKTVAEFIAAADKSTYYKLSGTVGGAINTTYGNFDLTDDTGTIYVFGTENISEYAPKLVSGAQVTLAAVYDYYEQTQKHEAVNAYILSIEGGDTPPGPSGEVKAVTIAEFNAAEESNSQVYELVGTIGGSINADYGNFDLTDETGTVYVYGLTATELGYGAKNDKSYASLGLKEGDKIKIHGYRGSFNGKIEVMYAWFIEKVGGDTPPGPSGEVKAVTIAEFNAAEESDSQVYELVGTIGGSINADYGNFDLTDETGTVYVYGLTATELGYGAKNDKSYASLGLNEGDKIKIRGYRGSFNGKIEVMYAWFIEKVADGGQGGGEGESSITIDFSAQGYENQQDFTGITEKGISITVSKGDNKNGPKFYTSGNAVRFYGGNSFTVTSSTKKISQIDISFGSGDSTNEITVNAGVWESPTWKGNATSVTFSIGGTTGNRRVAKLVVTLAEE